MDYTPADFQQLAKQRYLETFQYQEKHATLVSDYQVTFPGCREGYYRMAEPDCPGMLVLIHEVRPLAVVLFLHPHYIAFQLHSTHPSLTPVWDRLPRNIKRSFYRKLETFRLEKPTHLRLVKPA